MSQKPTSLAALAAQTAQKDALSRAAEDAKMADAPVPEGKVWVRLVNAHYDRYGVYHQPNSIAQLDADAVPRTAKVLTEREAEAELEAE